jgi:hypothetical protein
MSGEHDVLIVPPVLTLGVPLSMVGAPTLSSVVSAATTLAAVAAVGGVSYGAFLALRRLQEDYEVGLQEFSARADEAALHREEAQAEQAAVQAVATSLAMVTHQVAVDVSAAFLRDQVAKLVTRVGDIPSPDPFLPAECAALRAALAEPDCDVTALMERYHTLSVAVAAAAVSAAKTRTHALSAEMAALRQELQAPLLQDAECVALREQFTQQLAALDGMAARNPDVALQGVGLFRERLHRELQTLAERSAQRRRDADAVRELVADALARLRALATQTTMPEAATAAQALLARLADTLTGAGELAVVRALHGQALALYDAVAKALEEQAMTAYVSAQVRDVLQSLGYQVSEVPSEGGGSSLVAAVEGGVGVQFITDESGHLKTEVVAFSESAAVAGEETKERVCALTDKVFSALRERDWTVRERYRMTVKKGKRLPVIDLLATDTTSIPMQESHYLKADE